MTSIRPELEVTLANVQAIVDCVGATRTVEGVSAIHGGEIAAVYQITFADAEPPLVLKVYPDLLHWKMRKELNVLAMVQDRLEVAVPRILLADDSKRVLGLNFILMSKLDGAILRGLEPTLTPDQLTSAYAQIGQILRQFHRIPMNAFGYIGADGILMEHPSNHAYLSFQFERKLKEFVDRGGTDRLARRVAGYVARWEHLLRECTRPVLCHNDLHYANLLADLAQGTVRLTGVLDFEGALAGDPLFDVAKALYYLTDERRAAILAGYGDMERRQWSETLALYHLYFVLELWCWMALIGNTAPLDKLAQDLERFSAE